MCEINTPTLLRVFPAEFNIHEELRETATRLPWNWQTMLLLLPNMLGLICQSVPKQNKMSPASNSLTQDSHLDIAHCH